MSITNENICAVFYVAINAVCTKPDSVYSGGEMGIRMKMVGNMARKCSVLQPSICRRIYFILSYFMAAVNMHFSKGLVVALLFRLRNPRHMPNLH